MFLIPHETVWEKALSKRIFYWNSPWAFWTPGARTGFNRSLERQGFFTSAVGPRLALALWTDPLHREEVVALRQTPGSWKWLCRGGEPHRVRPAAFRRVKWAQEPAAKTGSDKVNFFCAKPGPVRFDLGTRTGNRAMSAALAGAAGGGGVCMRWLYIPL